MKRKRVNITGQAWLPLSFSIGIFVLAVCTALVLISCNSGGGSEDIRPYDDSDTSGTGGGEADDDNSADDDEEDTPSVGTDVGDRIPNFSLTNQDGSTTTLWDSEGKVILLACAATW